MITKGTYEIFDLHPDQLAKYNIGGSGSDFEKFLTYGATAISLIGSARIKRWLGLEDGRNLKIGEAGTLDPAEYENFEIGYQPTPHKRSNGDPGTIPGGMASIMEIVGTVEDVFSRGYMFPDRRKKGAVRSGLPGALVDSADGVTESGGGDTLPGDPSVVSPYEVIVKAAEARVNAVLEERSFLDFEFPHPDLGTRRVAMWENPEITETRSPNYARQAIVQRNEPARLYIGSDPRKVTLRFTYTLPFIEEYLYKANTKPAGFTDDVTSPRPSTALRMPSFSPSTVKQQYLEYIQSVLRDHLGVPGVPGTLLPDTFTAGRGTAGWEFRNKGLKGPTVWDGLDRKEGISSPIEAGGPLPQGLHGWAYDGQTMGDPQMEAIAYTLFVIDTIRASVIGDNMDIATYGPPIVRFRHGIVYTQNPFILTSYNIDFNSKSGVDPRTLIPRQVRFSLEMEEFHQTTGAHHGEFNEDLPGSSDLLSLDSPVKNSLRTL